MDRVTLQVDVQEWKMAKTMSIISIDFMGTLGDPWGDDEQAWEWGKNCKWGMWIVTLWLRTTLER